MTRDRDKRAFKVPTLLFRKVTNSLYFLPAAITIGAILTAFGALALEQSYNVGRALPQLWWNDPESARAFLSTSATVMITITGVAFSVVVVALTLASNQFCPRVLTRYVENRVNRLVFGILTGNFAFALTLLACQQRDPDSLPVLSLTLCFLFDLASTIVFIYFVHHTATSLQVDTLAADLREATLRNIRRLKSEAQTPILLGPADGVLSRLDALGRPTDFPAGANGYIQAVRVQELLDISARLEEPIDVVAGLGDWVTQESPCIYPLDSEPDEDTVKSIVSCFEVGNSRRLEHDIAYGFRELVDIALKAVSPGVNDPTTAIMCLENLGTMMESLCHQGWPPVSLFGSVEEEGKGSVRFHGNGPEDYLRLITEQMTVHIVNAPRLGVAILDFLCRVSNKLESDIWREVLIERADAVIARAATQQFEPRWMELLQECRAQLQQLLSRTADRR